MINFAEPYFEFKEHRNEILEAITNVLDNGKYILGPEVDKFEKSFASFCNTKYAVGVNSGTDALILAMRALGIGPGDEVISVSHTAIATIAAIIATGATPVLVDIEPDYYGMSTKCIANALTSKTKAIVPVHLYGHPSCMDPIMEIANNNNLFVIEDCAQAVGAIYKGKKVGAIGDVGCFSFYPSKNLGGMGDAGIAITNNEELEDKIRRLRQYGWNKNRITEEVGLNSRLDEVQAAILNIKLKYLDKKNKRRREIANLYNKILDHEKIKIPTEHQDAKHIYNLYVINTLYRDDIRRELSKNRIMTGIHYPYPVHYHKGYSELCAKLPKKMKITESIASKILSLPIYPGLKNDEVERIGKIILSSLT
jgi:dTDP-4-amino-4,6-dideoxygalactose transaminase